MIAQFNILFDGESFKLVAETDNSRVCPDCGRSALLISGRCEPCNVARNQDLAAQEARQRSFFGREVV